MTASATKCSKPQGTPCRLHNPAPKKAEVAAILSRVSEVVPRNRDEGTAAYYAATDRKHFGDRTEPGSKFLDTRFNRVEHVLQLAMVQRGNMDGDDREALIQRGADRQGFMDGKRYLMVNTPGTVGVMNSADLPDDAVLEVMETKPGAPCSLVYTTDTQPSTDYAVVVLAKDKATENDLLITTFPGPITKPLANPDIDALKGQKLTAGEARSILKGQSFWVNTRL
jgi:hypothetical protein